MKKVLKSIICCLAVMVLALPVALLVGCGKDETAKAVKNRNYYISSATINGGEDYTLATEGNLRIIFRDGLFKVEIGETGSGYGCYGGTYKTDKTHVYFTIDPAQTQGAFSTNDQLKQFMFDDGDKCLTYSNSQLKVSYFYNSDIIELTFAQKKDK